MISRLARFCAKLRLRALPGLMELRTAAARIATVGEYYRLRARSTRAIYAEVLSGLIGTAAVVAAFAWPLQ